MTRITANLDAEHIQRLTVLQDQFGKTLDEIIAAAIDSFYRQKSDSSPMADLSVMDAQSMAHLEEEFSGYQELYPYE